MICFRSEQLGGGKSAAAAVSAGTFEGDEHLIRAAVETARLFRRGAGRSGRVRPIMPAAMLEAFALFSSGWTYLAQRLLEELEGMNRLTADYLLAASVVETAWRYQLCRSGIVRIGESPAWSVVATVDLTRIRGGELALDMTLKQIFRRIVESQADFWGRRSGRGAVRLVLPAEAGAGRAQRGSRGRGARRNVEWRLFARWCFERMAVRGGWREVPVVLDR